jgi:hypothetical protein
MSNELRYERDYQHITRAAHQFADLFRCSVLEFAFVVSFVANLIVGNIIHTFSTNEEVYNYFNDKGNLFNRFFVKQGWAWTTLVIVVFYGVTIARSKSGLSAGRVLARAAFNYTVATVWWIFFTQWFFGQPIMDRVFVLTGGHCHVKHSSKLANHQSFDLFRASNEDATMYKSPHITSSTCRQLQGSWIGGHDPSGHVFLLIHSSLYLVFESLPYWSSWNTILANVQATIRDSTSSKWTKLWQLVVQNPNIPLLTLVGLWWWMLFMTSLYFHSVAEKFVGLLFGYVVFAALYYLPRWSPASTIQRKQD